jgi:hypothetical protein
LLAFAVWPCTGRYTSFGFECERIVARELLGDYFRLRWPGDGSICLLWVRERRPVRPDDAANLDLGAAWLQPASDLQPQTPWQRAGFWNLAGTAGAEPVPALVAGAERWWVVGLPHGLLVALLLAGAVVAEWRARRRAMARSSCLAAAPPAA